MNREPTPQTLLIHDLQTMLGGSSDPVAKAALRRVNLFSLMYLEGTYLGSKLVLKDDSGHLIVADELDHAGRCHVLDHPPHYAIFDRSRMVLEYRKAAIDIVSIVYEADEWPADLLDKTPDGVRLYFTGEPL